MDIKMKSFIIKNKLTVGAIFFTTALAIVTVITALGLNSLRAPNAPESRPDAADLQCQNGSQNRDQNMWLICECANGCTQKCDTSQGGGGCGWTCDQNCRLVPRGTQPQGSCTQVDYVHTGSSSYCGVANINCPTQCQTGTGVITQPKGLCDDTCNTDADCENTSPTGARITCNTTIKKCVNTLCPGDTIPGNNCDCRTAVQTCGQPCGGGYPLCGAGSTCVYIKGPTCTASSVSNPTSYCVPVPFHTGYTAANCVSRDQGNSYLRQGTKTTFTSADIALACAAPATTAPSTSPTATASSSPTGTATSSPTSSPITAPSITMACTKLSFTLSTTTPTATSSPTPSATASPTPTTTATATSSPTPSATASPTPTSTVTSSPTNTPTTTKTATPTSSPTTSTATPTTNSTSTPTAVVTPSPKPQLPHAGVAWPTIALGMIGALLVGIAFIFTL